jgi:phosphoribosylamine-glycine ligase
MIAIVSETGDGAGLAVHLTRQGNDVAFIPKDHSCMPMLQGVVKRVAQYPPVSHYDLTLIDGLGFDRLSHWWRKRGPVIGGNTLEIWEKKRELGLEVMEHAGLRMSTTHAFDNLPAAEKFLRQAEGDWYFKPDGHVPKAMTRKGDTETLLRFLHWARPQLAKVPRFVLQAPAPDGCEIDVAVWFDGKQPVSFEVTIEEKKFMVGDHGPALGCASNIVWEIPESCRLVKLALAPFLDALAASNYVGIAAVNTIITPTLDVYGLEWTMRTGWDSTQASCAIFDESLATQLTEFAQGGLSQFYRPKKAGMTLRLSMPPQPMENSKDDKQQVGLPLPSAVLDDHSFWPEDVACERDGPVSACGSGFLGAAVTTGTDVTAMRSALLATADGLDIPDLMYRTDPVSRLEEALKFLHEHRLCPTPLGTPSKGASVPA